MFNNFDKNLCLYKSIKNYNKKNIYPFHMPGHKRNKKFLNFDFLDFDKTEFFETDNLHNPQTFLLNSQIFSSKVFNSKYSFFSVNGSSCLILAAILSQTKPKDKIIVSRNCHMSVYNAIFIGDLEPVYVYPQITKYNILGGINTLDFENTIIKNLDCKAIIITNPTYEGICSDIVALSKIAKKYNKLFIVDEAHGAHFCFNNHFPKSSVSYADITIQSLHKTLATLGQSAILHVNNPLINILDLKKYISFFNTTSPSYILLSSIDYCLHEIYKNPKYFIDFVDFLKDYRKKFENLENILLLDNFILNQNSVHNIDISKFVFIFFDKALNGYNLYELFVKKFKLQLETYSPNYLLALSTYCDTKQGFDLLFDCLSYVDKLIKSKYTPTPFIILKSFTVFNPKDAYYMPKKTINFFDCVDQISSEFVTCYPPGIPLIVPGELITKSIYQQIVYLKNNNCNFVGCIDTNLNTIDVVYKEK